MALAEGSSFRFESKGMNEPVKVLDLVVDGEVGIGRFYNYVLENEAQVASAIEELSQYLNVGEALVVRKTTRAEMFNEDNSKKK